MRRGIGLNDQQRLGWLVTLHKLLYNWYKAGKSGVLACSALKQKYRHLLNSNLIYDCNADDKENNNLGNIVNLNVVFILLNCDKSVISGRLKHRVDHDIIKDANILDSQFAALEAPPVDKALWIDSQQNYLNIERSDVNSYLYYYIYSLKCTSDSTIPQNVNNALQFINEFKYIPLK